MTTLIAFDCDGTLSTSKGPIPVSRLQELNVPPYIQVVIVSPSPKCQNLPYPKIVNGSTRTENLVNASNRYPSIFKVYISDNTGDDKRSKDAGFAYIHPKDFK